MQRLALGISYQGQGYHGWQSQPSGNTVQDKLEAALARFSGVPVSTVCAGRTDSGVHGLMQVAHFDTDVLRDLPSWIRGPNSFLPSDIAVQWAKAVPPTFHSRASAISRRYSYVLLESPVRPSLEAGRVGWVFRPLNEGAMREAAQLLIGEHDFTSFRASACQALSPVKHMTQLDIHRRGSYWRFDFEANAFLHHMIRNIMGCLVQIGQNAYPPSWMQTVLHARDRRIAAPTFAPDGLYFLGPTYDTAWELPQSTCAYDWLP